MKIDIEKSLWVMTENYFSFPPYRLLFNLLKKKNVKIFLYSLDRIDLIDKLKKLLVNDDRHFIFYYPLDKKLILLKDILLKRKNFSAAFSDWWTVPNNFFWDKADYLIFNHYNAIRAINSKKYIELKTTPPVFSIPPNLNLHDTVSSLTRFPYLFTLPLLEIERFYKRRNFNYNRQILYFPFAIDSDAPEFTGKSQSEPEYDFANVGSVSFFCRVKNCFAPASLSFINLYEDRLKITDVIKKLKDYRLFDCRNRAIYGEETIKIIKKSKYVISTGGYQQASILKYLEIVAAGTPILGYKIPFEYPILNESIYEIDILSLNKKQIKGKLDAALLQYKSFKNSALKARKKILTLYNQDKLLDLLQKQFNGQDIPMEYIKV